MTQQLYVINFFKKGDTIQRGTLLKVGHYLRKYGKPRSSLWRRISGSFFLSLLFSCSQVIIKKSSNDNFFCSKKGFEWNHTIQWKLYHFEPKKLSFDDFLMTTWEQENKSERKNEPEILLLCWPPPKKYFKVKIHIFLTFMLIIFFSEDSTIFCTILMENFSLLPGLPKMSGTKQFERLSGSPLDTFLGVNVSE